MTQPLQLEVGIKADPIQYRYSYDWLFRLLAAEGVHHVQLGTFFEIYQLPDQWFRDLRRKAEDFGITISSIFTAHRELGGFFRPEAGWEEVARRNFARLIEVGGLLGATSVGSNPGAVLRDQMGIKSGGTATYVWHLKELMRHAHDCGVRIVGIEPMSCLAEPPTLPEEIRAMMEELDAHHAANPATTARAGLCSDVSHGYCDAEKQVIFDHMQLLEAALPWTTEIHLKNTDAIYNSTFGFSEAERERGVVDIAACRDLLLSQATRLPVQTLIGYLEIGGPKLGRDYSDLHLGDVLRTSLRWCKEHFTHGADPAEAAITGATIISTAPRAAGSAAPAAVERPAQAPKVAIAPSMMCADMKHLAEEIERLERAGCDWLHWDVMDAHYVPNMPVGLATIVDARPVTALPFDVHLMTDRNDFFIERLAPAKPDWVTVHAESSTHLDRTLQLIKSIGAKAGVALNPATPLTALEYVLEQLDYVLIMTVNPGYAGQALVPSAWRKIADTRDWLAERGLTIPIEVDGNVSFENIPRMVASGADVLVAGTSSVFHKDGSRRENVLKTRAAIAEGLAQRTQPQSRRRDRAA